MRSRTLIVVPVLLVAFASFEGCSGGASPTSSLGAGDASVPTDTPAAACASEHADCDHEPANGCESIVSVDTENCGRCGHICGTDHGKPTCDHRLCRFECEPDYANCDGDDSNGCESYLPSDAQSCGACNEPCPAGGNQRPTCTSGVCGTECYPGTADCNGDIRDGCEANLETPEACGSCQHRCGKYMGVPGCSSAACQWNCDDTYAHCGASDATGCETNLATDPQHCGDCATVCPSDKPRCFNRMCST